MERRQIEERVAQVVRATVPEGGDLTGEFVLLGEDGAFDSVTALELVLALEREFAIVVQDEDVRPENLRNVECIVDFVAKKLENRR